MLIATILMLVLNTRTSTIYTRTAWLQSRLSLLQFPVLVNPNPPFFYQCQCPFHRLWCKASSSSSRLCEKSRRPEKWAATNMPGKNQRHSARRQLGIKLYKIVQSTSACTWKFPNTIPIHQLERQMAVHQCIYPVQLMPFWNEYGIDKCQPRCIWRINPIRQATS